MGLFGVRILQQIEWQEQKRCGRQDFVGFKETGGGRWECREVLGAGRIGQQGLCLVAFCTWHPALAGPLLPLSALTFAHETLAQAAVYGVGTIQTCFLLCSSVPAFEGGGD